MGYEKDPDRDEDENPLTFDDVDSEEDDPQEDDGDTWRRQERSPTPVYNDDGKSKPRKRLVKKISVAKGLVDEDEVSGFDDVADDVPGFDDVAEEEEGGYDEVAAMGKRKKFSSASSSKGKGFDDVADEEVERYDDVVEEEEGGYDEVAAMGKRKKFSSSSSKGKKKRRESGFSGGDDVEKEMWDTVAGNDSEDDQNGERTMDDENFIDDTGVDPADRYGSDNERGSPINAPQAEEGEEEDEIQKLFKSGKKKKKSEKSAGEIALLVESVMAELEVVAEEDAELNRRSKPAINKLIKLPFLTDVLSKKQLQQEFLDHGVLTLLKNWLEPLPDGSLPNINIREAILRILTDFPIDLDQHDRREQLKRSGLGKVIMFLSKTDEETTTNRKLAKDLVDKWSRPIFNKSTRFEDMRNYEDERVPSRRPIVRKPTNKAPGMQSRDPDLDEAEFSQRKKSGQASSSVRGLTTRPEAMALDFMVRPQSKIDPDEVRARAKQIIQDQRRIKMQKKLTQLKAPKKKQLQATKLSVEGRGMVKYL